MNEATQAPAEGAAAAPAAKKTREAVKVAMSDGREVEFVGKQKLLKEGIVILNDGAVVPVDEASDEQVAAGTLAVRMDFKNGATRTYPLNTRLLHRFAVHGGLQKYGDQLAGGVKNEDGSESQDLDDWALETDALHDQLNKDGGVWAKARVGGGGGGTSVLLQALMEYTGQSLEAVKEHIKDWTPADKITMRNTEEIKPIIERIEKEKAAKAGHVDVGAKLAGLKALAAAQPAAA